MSEISGTAFKLIYDLEKTAELCGYVKSDRIGSKRTAIRLELRDYIASLESQLADASVLIDAAADVIEYATIEDAPSDAYETWSTMNSKWQSLKGGIACTKD